MQSLHGDVPNDECANPGSAAVDNDMVLNIYTLCPTRFVLRIFPICIVL
jgi:hypothetical protein